MLPVAIVFICTFVIIFGLMMLVQALVGTELEIARQSLTFKKAAMTQQEQEVEIIKNRHQTLTKRIAELESSRQDLFKYVVKQEHMLEEARSRNTVSLNEPPVATLDNGTPLV